MTYAQACKLLNIAPTASEDEAKRAYRRLVRSTHPDKNPDNPHALESFRAVQEAWDIVKVALRETQAETVIATVAPVSAREAWPGTRVPQKGLGIGASVRGSLHLKLAEVFRGCSADVTFPDEARCERCSGTGDEPGAIMIECPACQGMDRRCDWCSGKGELTDVPCSACHGASAMSTDRTVRVQVPRSIKDGDELILAERGRWGRDGRGELRLRVNVEEPRGMRRTGDDLEVDARVEILEAVFGGHAQVHTLEDLTHTIVIKPGTSSGRRLRIPGEGMYRASTGDERGDLYAVIHIDVPGDLTDRQRYLYMQLLEEERRKT